MLSSKHRRACPVGRRLGNNNILELVLVLMVSNSNKEATGLRDMELLLMGKAAVILELQMLRMVLLRPMGLLNRNKRTEEETKVMSEAELLTAAADLATLLFRQTSIQEARHFRREAMLILYSRRLLSSRDKRLELNSLLRLLLQTVKEHRLWERDRGLPLAGDLLEAILDKGMGVVTTTIEDEVLREVGTIIASLTGLIMDRLQR